MCHKARQAGADMQNFLRNHKRLAEVAALATSFVLATVLWSVSASARGQMVARFDTGRRHYEVLGYGLPLPWRAEYALLLRERYGIHFRTMALCIVSRTFVSYIDGYNAVSTAAANRKFGHDVFKECAEEARKSWEQTNAKSRNSTP
jgi:hypothetical protein